jgi:hypothetical protein
MRCSGVVEVSDMMLSKLALGCCRFRMPSVAAIWAVAIGKDKRAAGLRHPGHLAVATQQYGSQQGSTLTDSRAFPAFE